MAAHGGQYRWDENMISARCSIEGCDGRVVGDTRCQLHGGHPKYEWRESAWGVERVIAPREGHK